MKYFRPNIIDEYFEINKISNNKNITLFAGGTDLMPRYEQGKQLPNVIVDLKALPTFKGIKENGISLEIGSVTSIEEIKSNALIKNQFPALQQSTVNFGSVQIRNRATIGGNICNASPAGDTLPALYAYEAKLLLQKKNRNRLVNIKDFIVGPGKTTIEKGEVLQTIILPMTHSKALFYKLGLREAMAISVINFAVVYEDNKFTIAIGACSPTIKKFSWVTKFSIDQILKEIDEAISPIDDIRATALYRRKVLQNILKLELSKIFR